MPSPSSAVSRFDLSLSYGEFSQAANRRGYVGLKVLPAIGVGKNSASFAKLKIAQALTPIEDTYRAPKGSYKRDDFEWGQDTYATEEHGVEEITDDRLLAIYGSEIRAEQIATQRAINRVLQAFEAAVAAAVFNTTTWTGASLTTAVSVPWSTLATAVPITDIDAAIEKVRTNIGLRPNTLILTDFALRKIKRTAQLSDLLKYSGQDDPKNLGVVAGLKTLFDLPNIIVADGFKNTAGVGAASATLSRLWDTTMAMVCHVNDDGDLESPVPRVGNTIMWTEENEALPGADAEGPNLIMEKYREENRRGDVLRARFDRQIKIIHHEAGHLLTAVTA